MRRITAFYQDITRVKADILVAGITTDLRPPRGLAGKVDWYMGGFLSRQILGGKLDGRPGVMTMIAIQGKLLTPRLLLVGVGAAAAMTQEDAASHFRPVGDTVRELGLQKVALEIPAIETPKSGVYDIVRGVMKGFRRAFKEERGPGTYCEIQILARTEEESEGWRRVLRNL
jgi:hypothetical protein